MKNILKSLIGLMILSAVLFSCKATDETHEHTYSEIKVIIEPTCVTKGARTYKCSVCNEIITESISELYSSPIDAETGETANATSKYVYFGVFPKTVKESSVTVDETVSVTMGANTYFRGEDGEWYIKLEVNPSDVSSSYSNGLSITRGNIDYFKVEPIKWKILTTDYNGTGKVLLMADEVLTAKVSYYDYRYYAATRTVESDTDISHNNYKYSQIRAYLNGIEYYCDSTLDITSKKNIYKDKGFLQTAFSSSAQNLIAETTVDNSAASTTDTENKITKAEQYACADTTDKIFLLSNKEITTSVYGSDNTRIRFRTDYTKANKANGGSVSGYGGSWWLRSPSNHEKDLAFIIDSNGSTGSTFVYFENYGIVPALTISF